MSTGQKNVQMLKWGEKKRLQNNISLADSDLGLTRDIYITQDAQIVTRSLSLKNNRVAVIVGGVIRPPCPLKVLWLAG